ncbi:hypothetical protein [Kyrpidia sp.]|uniref:hypothetical protein n=1 Tax=Kyrpidia sp. TaxID=2073077 RepID=UPI00258E1117|nr:hypothetical protein [Kyrpidia sp.]MCL6576833.1 hypothetical protein [Kyrpidia sp.]
MSTSSNIGHLFLRVSLSVSSSLVRPELPQLTPFSNRSPDNHLSHVYAQINPGRTRPRIGHRRPDPGPSILALVQWIKEAPAVVVAGFYASHPASLWFGFLLNILRGGVRVVRPDIETKRHWWLPTTLDGSMWKGDGSRPEKPSAEPL